MAVHVHVRKHRATGHNRGTQPAVALKSVKDVLLQNLRAVHILLVHNPLRAMMRRKQQIPLQILLAVLRLAVLENLHDRVVRQIPEEQNLAVNTRLVGQGHLHRQRCLVPGGGSILLERCMDERFENTGTIMTIQHRQRRPRKRQVLIREIVVRVRAVIGVVSNYSNPIATPWSPTDTHRCTCDLNTTLRLFTERNRVRAQLWCVELISEWRVFVIVLCR